MSLVRILLPLVCVLSGCAGPEAGFGPTGWAWPFTHPQGQAGRSAGAATTGGYAQYSFDWQLSGDPEIMPVQVFDDGAGMWLQFSPEGAWPAVFEVSAAGWRPLPYRRELPYMVLDGIHEHLELRGGHLRGTVKRVGGGGQTEVASSPLVADAAQEQPEIAAPPLDGAGSRSLFDDSPGLVSDQAPGTEVVTTDTGPAAPMKQPSELQAPTPLQPVPAFLGAPVSRYAVSPADHTIRQALERWARTASWIFSAEHWAVDVDIPLVGEAAFETDFKSAVRELLAATEMGDRPLQPCFYSNRVLRVVPYAQACDRGSSTRTTS